MLEHLTQNISEGTNLFRVFGEDDMVVEAVIVIVTTFTVVLAEI